MNMKYTPEYIAELEVLLLYDLSTTQEGIKIHKSADPDKISAAQRLYNKKFITQVDGGYLTNLGREAAEHAQFLYTMLKTG